MLYDPKWEKKIETKPGLASFIEFLASMPVGEEYDVESPRQCALGKWSKKIGQDIFCCTFEADEVLGCVAWEIVGGYPRTYGAALKRARACAANV